ncbi:uncharacterized protein LOC101857553 [Aplysia californica]|uniref:Uncharacterized protein LOC101857553 n=1 Tax=Aplysia californica TaxID=6500 RepID=A0ABM1VQP6_APLCA|nr:uncharacterized protein LOC101857553 [Aplysia californica]
MAGHQSLPPVYKGRVTHVIDPSNFWMRIGSDSNFDNFGLYQRKFDEFLNGGCQEFPDSIGSLELGDCVMVADAEHASGVSSSSDSESEQSHWERAQVFSVDTDSGTVDVFYIDQGFTQIVKFSRVRLANQEIFQCFPPQAHHCELSSIVPLSKAWTRRAVTVFESQVTGRDLVVCVRAAVQPDGYCSVQLFYRWKESGPWLSVASHMLEEEVAMSSGGELEYDELPAQFVEAALLQMEEEQHAVCSDADGTQEAGSDVEVDQQSDHEAGRLSVSETQRCSPHEDVGQPSVNEAEPMSENKRRRPLEAELASSSPPSSSSSPPPSPTEVCSVHSEGREDSRVSEPELGLRKSCDQSVYLPSPSEFMAPPHPGTHSPCDVATESGGIPKVDVKNVFQETSHVDLWQMKEDKVSEAQRHVRSRLELDLHDGSDVEEEGGDSDTEYGEWVGRKGQRFEGVYLISFCPPIDVWKDT